MRTTILIGSLLFLAGSALAQDSPIRVGDSSTKPPPLMTASGHTNPDQWLYVETDQFQYDSIHFVSAPNHKAVCFTVFPKPTGFTPVPLSLPWKLTLKDKVEVMLSSTSDDRIEIDYKQHPVVLHNMPAGVQRQEVRDEHPKSGVLTVKGTPTTYARPRLGGFIIHYCQVTNGVVDCTDPKTGADTCK